MDNHNNITVSRADKIIYCTITLERFKPLLGNADYTNHKNSLASAKGGDDEVLGKLFDQCILIQLNAVSGG